MKIQLEADAAYTLKGIDEEKYNYTFANGLTVDDYVLNIIKRGKDNKTWNGSNVLYAQVTSLTVEEFLMATSLSKGKVYYYNPFIKVSEANIDNQIPESLPNRTYTTNTGTEEAPVYTESTHTWRTWRGTNYPLSDSVDGYYYFISATFGTTLSSDNLLTIYNSDDATLVDSRPASSGAST